MNEDDKTPGVLAMFILFGMQNINKNLTAIAGILTIMLLLQIVHTIWGMLR